VLHSLLQEAFFVFLPRLSPVRDLTDRQRCVPALNGAPGAGFFPDTEGEIWESKDQVYTNIIKTGLTGFVE
jgi:hypothetical protein